MSPFTRAHIGLAVACLVADVVFLFIGARADVFGLMGMILAAGASIHSRLDKQQTDMSKGGR